MWSTGTPTSASEASIASIIGVFAASLLGIMGIAGFLVAVVSSVAWYFRARTAGLTAIDARLADLEAILKAEAEKARQQDAAAGESLES